MAQTFSFDGTPASQFTSGFTNAKTFSATENSVKFTFSINTLDNGGFAYNRPDFSSPQNSINMWDRGNLNDTFRVTLEKTTNATQNQFAGTIGDKVSLDATALIGSWKISFTNSIVGGTVVVSNVNNVTDLITAVGQFTGIKFTSTGVGYDEIRIGSMSVAAVNCFLTGTLISTPDGPRAVETLAPEVTISTADGGETTVKWLGVQNVPTRLMHPAKINPICIAAGALADGIPARDLFVSQDHAIAIDGMLINAGVLVNGSTIYQVAKMPLDGFTYYHVETDAHELLLAEGCAAETFIDYAGRDSFVNGDERYDAPAIQEMDMPRISAARLVPEALRARLHERAEAMTGTRRVA